MTPAVYVAAPLARVERAVRVADQLRAAGVEVVSRWHDGVRPGDQDPTALDARAACLARNLEDLARATVVLALLDAGAGRETYVEVGRALARGVRVVMVAERGGLPLSSADRWALVVRTDARAVAVVAEALASEATP